MLKQKFIGFTSVVAARKKIILCVIALCAILLGGAMLLNSFVGAQSTGDTRNTQSNNNAYMEETVVRSDIVVGVTEMGSSTVVSEAVTVPFETTVSEIWVKAGEYVTAGDLIATIDPQALDDLYEEAQNALYEAELKLQEAQLTASTQKLTAEQNYDKDISGGNNAQSTYEQGYADLEEGYVTIVNEITALETQLTTNATQIASYETAIADATTEAQAKVLAELTAYSQKAGLVTVISEEKLKEEYDAIDKTDLTLLTQEQLAVVSSYEKIEDINSAAKQTVESASAEITKLQTSTTEANTNLAKKYTERDDYAATLEQARTELYQEYETSMLNYNNAGAEYNNTINTINNTVATAQATVDDLQSELDVLTAMATDGSITAPIDGYIMTVVSTGAELRADETVANIANSEIAYVSVSIPQEDIADIEIGMPVNILFDAYEDIIISSEVDSISISPSAGMQSSVNYTVTMICAMSGVEEVVVFQGMTADVTFVEKQVVDALIISNKCLTIEDGKQYVQRLTQNGDIEKVEVNTGFSDGFDVEITSGLSEGDTVIIESAVTQNAS